MFGLGRDEQREEQGGITHAAVAILPVTDIAAAQRFFERLGFRVDFGDDDYLMLADGRGWQLHLRKAEPSFLKPANAFGLYLYTQDVDGLAAQFGQRAEQTEWGTYEFSVEGPDGVQVQIGWPTETQG